MPTTLTTPAVEQSTFAIVASFTDETGAAVAPNTGLTWTLVDNAGVVINSRLNVAITSASTITIVLHGADLALTAGASRKRRVLIKGTYNSSLGTNMEIKDEVTFSIMNLEGVP